MLTTEQKETLVKILLSDSGLNIQGQIGIIPILQELIDLIPDKTQDSLFAKYSPIGLAKLEAEKSSLQAQVLEKDVQINNIKK